jgi:hypothetical protein
VPAHAHAPKIRLLRHRRAIVDAKRDLEVIIARETVGSYDRDHEAISLRHMSGKIAFVGSVAEVVLCIRGTDLRG